MIVTLCSSAGYRRVDPLSLTGNDLQPGAVIDQKRNKRRTIDMRSDIFGIEGLV